MNEFNGEIKKMMIILSKATLENVYAAFVLANGARMEGHLLVNLWPKYRNKWEKLGLIQPK